MSKDSEVHERGTAEELTASRKLAYEIEQITEQYGQGIVPRNVWNSYVALKAIYKKQLEKEYHE